MEKEKNNKMMYSVSIDLYNASIMENDAKKIFIDDKQIGLSVGSQVHFGKEFQSTLLIDVHYDSEHSNTLTEIIPQLESFGNIIAINPKFKDQRLINKLKELDIISDTIDRVNYKNKEYELVKVNIPELMEYKPFGDGMLKDFKDIEYHNEKTKGEELE